MEQEHCTVLANMTQGQWVAHSSREMYAGYRLPWGPHKGTKYPSLCNWIPFCDL